LFLHALKVKEAHPPRLRAVVALGCSGGSPVALYRFGEAARLECADNTSAL